MDTSYDIRILDSVHEPNGTTNIHQADDNEPFNEYNSDK